MARFPVVERMAVSPRHATAYLAAGPERGIPVIFVHGWPELAISWRHQLACLGGLGIRAVAPDMRGYGRSSVYRTHDAYAQRHLVADMLELLDSLGAEKAVWVGHDWGSPTVWNLASHHPERCLAVASLCVPYFTLERGLDAALALVDRRVYPAETYPAGQWDYMKFYEESFATATALFDKDPYLTAKLLFRKGDPAGRLKPARTAAVREAGGWFGGATALPDLPRDADVVDEADLAAYAAALRRNGFFGPDSYYMNHADNAAYAASALNGGRLDLPVLFLHARNDFVCETVDSPLAGPMRTMCTDLEERIVDSGHWMAQERPAEVNAALVGWLARKIPAAWPA